MLSLLGDFCPIGKSLENKEGHFHPFLEVKKSLKPNVRFNEASIFSFALCQLSSALLRTKTTVPESWLVLITKEFGKLLKSI